MGAGQEVVADGGDAFEQGRGVEVVQPGRGGRRALDKLGDGVGEVVDGGDEKVTAAHGGVEHFEVEGGGGGVEAAELVDAHFLLAAVALEGGGAGLEGGAALLDERPERALDDQVDERLGRVEAAAVLAGVAVGAHFDLAAGGADRFALEQALVDGAKLLDAHVAVVDKAAAAGIALGVAEVVDDRGQHGVGEAHVFEQGRGLLREQTAVVGRQTDGRVALVDLAAEGGDVVVIAAGEVRKSIAGGHPLGDIVAYQFAQAVVIVAAVVDRQQVAVLGVEEEEEAVEEDERGLADIVQLCAATGGEGADQGGIDVVEDDAGKVIRDLLLVAAAFGEGILEQAGVGALLRAEGGAAKEQAEAAQAVGVLLMEEGFEVYLVEAAGAGAGAAVVEAPDAAVGEDAPADAPVGTDVGGGEVAQELGMGRAGQAALVAVAGVKEKAVALAFGDRQGVGVAVRAVFGGGAGLGVGVGEEQMVGNVLVAFVALLGQVVGPA